MKEKKIGQIPSEEFDQLSKRAMIRPVGEGLLVCLPLDEVERKFKTTRDCLKEQGVMVAGTSVMIVLPYDEEKRASNYGRLSRFIEEGKELLPEEKSLLCLRAFAYWFTLTKRPEFLNSGGNLGKVA